MGKGYPPLPGGSDYGALLGATRRLLDAVAGADAPGEIMRVATAQLLAASQSLEAFQGDEAVVSAGRRPDLPGHGHPGLIPHVELDGDALTGRGEVTFTRSQLGGGGAAHGGTIPLMFDDLLGRQCVRRSGQFPPRTAYLHVDYRMLTPVNVPLTTRTEVEQVDRRKIVVRGELRLGEDILAEARALFLMAEPVGDPPNESASTIATCTV